MGKDGGSYAFFAAPSQLGGDRSVADGDLAAPADDRAQDAGAIADVQANTGECTGLTWNSNEVRRLEDGPAAMSDAETDGGRADGVLYDPSLERETCEGEGPSGLDDVPVGDWVAVQHAPGFRGGEDRARGAAGQAGGVIRMGVGEEDGRRTNSGDAAEPIVATIDHHRPGAGAAGEEQRAMPAMPARAGFDFAAGAEEEQAHCQKR